VFDFDGKLVFVFGFSMTLPFGIAIDKGSHVIVGDKGSCAINVFNRYGKLLQNFDCGAPLSLVFNGLDGNVVVSSAHCIRMY
jgi:hypothetical protein